jgi:hypothetical protein
MRSSWKTVRKTENEGGANEYLKGARLGAPDAESDETRAIGRGMIALVSKR